MNAQTHFFQLFVRTVSGNTITLDVEPNDSIATVKSKIFNKDGTPSQLQRLSFASKQLHDSRSLLDYGIDRACTLHLSERLLGGLRLYHCTSRENAEQIKRYGFRCGVGGLAGGGIYFAECAADASRKAHNSGVVLECEVDLGRMRSLDHNGDSSMTLSRLNMMGFDSVSIARFGTEYCIYEPHRARVVREHHDPSSPYTPAPAGGITVNVAPQFAPSSRLQQFGLPGPYTSAPASSITVNVAQQCAPSSRLQQFGLPGPYF
jgi:ubiquitin C